MKIKDLVKKCIETKTEMNEDTVRKVVCVAYYIGREEAARQCCNNARAMISAMEDRAKKCRYSRMAERIIGDVRQVYSPDYAGDMGEAFGCDEVCRGTSDLVMHG